MYLIVRKTAPCMVLAALFAIPLTAMAGSGFLLDGQGKPVRDSSGHCIQIGKLTAEDAAFDCPGVNAPKGHARGTDTESQSAAQTTSPATPSPAPSTTAAPPETPPQPAQRLTRHTVTLIAKQQFASNSSYLSKAQKDELLDFVRRLLGHARLIGLTITSHTDASGTERYNRWLAHRRTGSVAAYLRSLGVDPRIITLQPATGPGTVPRGIEISAIVMDAR